MIRSFPRALAYLWAAPVSLAALPAALLGAATGGRIRVHRGVLEAGGGVLRPLLERGVPGFAIGAITFGTWSSAQTRARSRRRGANFDRSTW